MSNTPLKEMNLTRPGESSGLRTRFFPRVIGGTCEHCGVIDQNYPGNVQYKFCQHYSQFRDTGMKCVFCKETADHDDVVRMSEMLVMEDPYVPGNLVTLCKSYECTKKFEQKYHISPR